MATATAAAAMAAAAMVAMAVEPPPQLEEFGSGFAPRTSADS